MTTEVARTVGRPPQPVTVVVAHRRESDRASMVRWLAVDDRFTVVAEAADAATGVQAVTTTNPDVALIDIELPGDGGGIRAIATLTDLRPATRMVAVADRDDDQAYEALAAGAIGCYLWADPLSPIASVVSGAARGEGALTPGWAGRLVDEVGWLTREPVTGPGPAPVITPTELEVLRRVAGGATPAAIAALHGVTEHVVNLHAGLVITKVYRRHDDTRRLGAAR